MALRPDEILVQIGLRQHISQSDTKQERNDNEDVASQALAYLVQSGKLTIQDAIAAVKSIKEKPKLNGSKVTNQRTKDESFAKPREKYRTRHIALQFSYDGADFTGFAQNIGKEEDNSVEKVLFSALEKTRLLLEPSLIDFSVRGDDVGHEDGRDVSARTASKYSRCGRTDKGVHANGQVVALYLKSAFPIGTKLPTDSECKSSKELGVCLQDTDLPKNSLDGLECFVPRKNKKSKQNHDPSMSDLELKTITEYDYPRILNNILPPSIRVLGWCPVSSEFSARFSCSRRTYRYFFPRRNLDLSAMADGLRSMIGKHDFRNLCKMNCEQVYNFERMIIKGKIASPRFVKHITKESVDTSYEKDGSCSRDMCYVEIVGQAFLWHQIRCIMSVLFLIGRGLESPSVIEELLDINTNPAKPSYDMASENALVLQDCTFDNLVLGRSVKNLWDVTKVLETRWEKHAVAADRARDLIETVKKEQVRWDDLVAFVAQIAKERRRKEQKRDGILNEKLGEDVEQLMKIHVGWSHAPDRILWETAISVVEKVLKVYPHVPNGINVSTKGLTESTIHTPLMDRAKGTTYEEKVQSILGSESGENGKNSKRKERYEENIIKKRKTAEQDKAFYDRMLKQGGSSS